ncbi:AIPR family protein [Rothia mucilaginosa]|uniref:AIPR family protein n=1 Tax=Rothia mucilaginosa TaxID=43675 RepID=UPI0028DBEC5A|nr:AIPR family protein [Rothia mucilaginosa]
MSSSSGYQKNALLKSSINSFARKFNISTGSEDDLFEYFTGYVISSKHSDYEIRDPKSIHNGGANDQGIDSIAIIINGKLVTKTSDIDNFQNSGNELDVKYIFIQAKNQRDYKGLTAHISNFAAGVQFALNQNGISKEVTGSASQKFKDFIDLKAEIEDLDNLKKLPEVYLYFVTAADSHAEQSVPAGMLAKRDAALNSLNNISGFYKVHTYEIVGPEKLLDMYRKLHNRSEAVFDGSTLQSFTPVKDDQSVESIDFGYLPLEEYLKIIHDEDNRIKPSVFYDNVRSYIGGTKINKSIKDSLNSNSGGHLFFARNNGVTIITDEAVRLPNNKMKITNYSIVNGCQTSHILSEYYNERMSELRKFESKIPSCYRGGHLDDIDKALKDAFREGKITQDEYFSIDENIVKFKDLNEQIDKMVSSICVPVRIVSSSDEDVVSSITESTNKQNAIKNLNLESRTQFHKNLEAYFNGRSDQKLLYERLEGSSKTDYEYVNLDSLMRAFCSVYLREPNLAARSPQTIKGYLECPDTVEDKRKVFSAYHNRASYYLVAKMYADLLNRTNAKNMKDKDERNKNKRYKWHILYALFIEFISSLNSSSCDASSVESMRVYTSGKNENVVNRNVEKYLSSDFDSFYVKAYNRLNKALEKFESKYPDVEKGEISKNRKLVDFISAV